MGAKPQPCYNRIRAINDRAIMRLQCIEYEYSIIRLYRTRLYRKSVFIEVQSVVPPDTMLINTKDGYIETRIYRSIFHGPLNFDITGFIIIIISLTSIFFQDKSRVWTAASQQH